ncbi:sirohydrochlorin chelatase [Streptomyces sp. NPDC006879]|uniref:sirohydrochlorin chelatase n=1 Tax=Streptomyces sp. NPDC006879 TaxID=3364767 RepID=UPI00368F48A0
MTEPPALGSTAELLTSITAQLGTQLSGLRPRPVHPDAATTNPTNEGTRMPAHPHPAPALVLVAHGSRDPRALRTVTSLLQSVQELRPQLPVRLGHIELNAPRLDEALASLPSGRAVLVPLLLGRGHHVKQDLPRAAAAAPWLHIKVAAALGPHPLLVEALHDRLTEAGWPATGPGRRGPAVVLAAAGSRDRQSVADTHSTAVLLSERLGGVPVVPAFASAAAPTVPGAVRALTARGHHRVALASYFTAPGRFATQSAAAAPWIAAAPLGAHPALARLLLLRYDQALVGEPAMAPGRELATA